MHRGKTCCGCTNASVILNSLLWHVVFAEVGEKVIANDGVNGFESFAGSGLLVLDDGGRGSCGERGNNGSGRCSDGSHCGGETGGERTIKSVVERVVLNN